MRTAETATAIGRGEIIASSFVKDVLQTLIVTRIARPVDQIGRRAVFLGILVSRGSVSGNREGRSDLNVTGNLFSNSLRMSWPPLVTRRAKDVVVSVEADDEVLGVWCLVRVFRIGC